MKTSITIGILMLMLTSGFVMYSYDRSDDGVKILNDDDLKYENINDETIFELGLTPSDVSNQPQENNIEEVIKSRDVIDRHSFLV